MAKIKVEYIGDRSAVLLGKHILQGESREIEERFAEQLIGNPNYRIESKVEAKVEKTLPVEEVFTDPSVEALEAALTEGNAVDEVVEENEDQAEDDEETDDAE